MLMCIFKHFNKKKPKKTHKKTNNFLVSRSLLAPPPVTLRTPYRLRNPGSSLDNYSWFSLCSLFMRPRSQLKMT